MGRAKVTEMVCILDRSGSMYGKEKDTIRNYNEMLRKQKREEGEAYITTALFSDQCEVLYSHTPIASAKEMDDSTYYVYGNTALFDGIGRVFSQIDQTIADTGWGEEEKVLVFIITDGMENASRQYNGEQIHQMIEERQNRGWVILFFGTEMEAVHMAQKIGIRQNHTARYDNNEEGLKRSYQIAGDLFAGMREENQ